MRGFLRAVKDDGRPVYINFDRIERIEIQEGQTNAAVFLLDRSEPIMVTGDHYAALIEFLGSDQEAE